MIWTAIIVCTTGILCGLTGQYHGKVQSPSETECKQTARAALVLLNENPQNFKVRCVRSK